MRTDDSLLGAGNEWFRLCLPTQISRELPQAKFTPVMNSAGLIEFLPEAFRRYAD